MHCSSSTATLWRKRRWLWFDSHGPNNYVKKIRLPMKQGMAGSCPSRENNLLGKMSRKKVLKNKATQIWLIREGFFMKSLWGKY